MFLFEENTYVYQISDNLKTLISTPHLPSNMNLKDPTCSRSVDYHEHCSLARTGDVLLRYIRIFLSKCPLIVTFITTATVYLLTRFMGSPVTYRYISIHSLLFIIMWCCSCTCKHGSLLRMQPVGDFHFFHSELAPYCMALYHLRTYANACKPSCAYNIILLLNKFWSIQIIQN